MDTNALTQVPWLSILAAAGLIAGVIGVWVLIQYAFNPAWGTMDEPDASAFLRGSCGDAMKISLKFSDGKVADATYWTDGCRMSNACGAAAAKLALDKTPDELFSVDYLAVEHEAGVLTDEDRHCATLAAGTLHESARLYLDRARSPHGAPEPS
jgi:nitrogen fixation NifU-like protein